MKKSSIQCPSCSHRVFEVTLLCKCGKLIKLDQDVMNWIKEVFKILKAPYYRTSPISTGDSKRGQNLWQHHHKPRDALRSATKGARAFVSIWDGWQHAETYRKSPLAHNWSDAWVRYLDHVVHINIYHNATQPQRERAVNLLHLRSVGENEQAPLLWQRPGYREAKKDVSTLQKSKREKQVPCITVSDTKRLQNRIGPSQQKYVECLSTNWAKQFAEPERPQPSSSSSWSPSPTWWRKLEDMAIAQVARRHMVRTMVNETSSNSSVRRSRSIASRKLVQRDSRRQAQRFHHQPVSLTAILFFFLQKLLNLSFALSQ